MSDVTHNAESDAAVQGVCPDCGQTNEFEAPVTWPMTLECGSCGHESGTERWTWDLGPIPENVRHRLHALRVLDAMESQTTVTPPVAGTPKAPAQPEGG